MLLNALGSLTKKILIRSPDSRNAPSGSLQTLDLVTTPNRYFNVSKLYRIKIWLRIPLCFFSSISSTAGPLIFYQFALPPHALEVHLIDFFWYINFDQT